MIATYRRFVPLVLAVYIVAVTGIFVFLNMRLTIEWVAIILFIAALLSGRGLLFLRDWGVFIAVLIAWQLTSPLATRFRFPWHLDELINADQMLFFGTVPAVWLQQHFYHPGHLEPWDVVAAAVYLLHFLAPLAAGFLLWMTDRRLFQKYAFTFVLVAIAGFVTYIVYPAVPPWMAGQPLRQVGQTFVVAWGDPHAHIHLRGVTNAFYFIMKNWYNPYNGSIAIGGLHPMKYDNVAAMPSEHAMYPMLWFLFLRRKFGAWAYLCVAYIAVLLFSITYLGQHYIIDAVVGFAYAVVGYVTVMHVVPALSRWRTTRRAMSIVALRHGPELEEA